MRHTLSTILIALLVTGCLAEKEVPNCQKFKDGTFIMENDGRKTKIIRRGNTQFEFFDGDPTPLPFHVKWIDECTYTLSPKEEYFKTHPGAPRDGIVTVKIFKTTATSYTQTASSNFDSNVITAEIKLVKPE